MKKGLNVTLLTVAIAVMAFQAMAKAPVIGDIKDPVVGNENGATNATPFIYPDAFDIVAKASDDSTAAANVRWSYFYTGATEVYRINNVDRIPENLTGASLDAAIKEPGARRINGSTDDPVTPKDSSTATITIRNVKYAPITGQGATPAAGVIDAMPVTLFASDGTTYSSETVFFYTDNGGNDRLSPATAVWTPVMHQTSFQTQGTITWAWDYLIGSVTSTNNGGTAICLVSDAAGDNFASWLSSWGIFSVSQNTVYRIRARINGSQATSPHAPFCDLVVGNDDNTQSAGNTGFTLFGGDFMIFDNEGGANAPLLKSSTSGTTYNWYWAPACMLNPAFNNSTTLWTAGNANNRKMYMRFRVMDMASVGALTADQDSGSLCLNDLQIDSLPYSALTFTNAWTSAATLSTSNIQFVDYVGTASIDAGKLKIAPTTDSRNLTYGNAYPGDATMTDANSYASYDDNFPVPWEADTLYKVTYLWSAQDTTSENAPLDVIWTGMDCPSFEFILNSYVTSKVAGFPAMPKSGTPQEYIAFFYSHNVSGTAFTHRQRLRPRAEWANTPNVIESTSAGSFFIHGMRVDKVSGY